jgi:hypothetical protein
MTRHDAEAANDASLHQAAGDGYELLLREADGLTRQAEGTGSYGQVPIQRADRG